MDKKFIITNDEYTINKLVKLGFVKVSAYRNMYCFINDLDKRLTFDSDDNLKIKYTNKLVF